jgi:hypothetical protein
MKQYTLNGKSFNCPERWQDITIEQLLKLNIGYTRSLEAISICTGISEEEWSRSTDYALLDQVEQNLVFLMSQEGLVLEDLPKEFVFRKDEVSPLSDIGTLSIGQYQDLKDYINEFYKQEGDEVDTIRRLSLYPKIVSIYLQPIIDKTEYDWRKAEEYSKELFEYSAMEVSAWGSFFIGRFRELRSGIQKDAQMSPTMEKKLKQDLANFIKTSDSGRCFFPWRDQTSNHKTTY